VRWTVVHDGSAARRGAVCDRSTIGNSLRLSDDEVAFYDALAVNERAIDVMGTDELKVMATELVIQIAIRSRTPRSRKVQLLTEHHSVP